MEIEGRLWIKRQKASFLGRGRVELLEQIKREGSISKAAKAMQMSYKAAWDAVDAMNNLSPTPLVERTSGGKGGGGTLITPEGEEAIKAFRELERIQERLFEVLGDSVEDWQEAMERARRINMKTSARNQINGKVSVITQGSVNSEVALEIGGGTIYAIITNESLEEMGLEVGMEAYAIIKASWVMIGVGDPKGLSARNRLKGVLQEVVEGAVNGEVKIKVGEKLLTAIITNEAIRELELKAGMEAYAIIKASHVLLGV